MNVLFHVAAGPRIGFGHLVRCRSLARALGVPPVVCIRGSRQTKARAAAAGWTVVTAAALWKSRPTVVVADDPSAPHASAVLRRARRSHCTTVTIHDTARRAAAGDIAVDVSEDALLDPSIAIAQCWRHRPAPRRVLIALGGGSHVFALAGSITRALTARRSDLEIVVAAGFAPRDQRPALESASWVEAPDGLVCELSKAAVAVVAGGVTAYEACALGVPSVAVPVVAGQRPAVRRLAGLGAVLTASCADSVADQVVRLLGDRHARLQLAGAGPQAVDGRGVFRVADRIRSLHAA